MTKAGFGDHLKREREMRAVSLDEICAATRISVRFLEALENEEWEKLPGGVFNRGFVRAVARFLGLDEEGFVAEYAQAVEERSAPQVWTAQPQPKAPIPWLAWIGVAAVLALAGMGWLGWHWYAMRRARRIATASLIASTTNPPLSADISTAPGAPQTVPNGDMELKIEAGKATTLEVSADGKPAFTGAIIAGQNRTFSAHDTFDVSAQDGGAVLLQLNGRTLAPIGPPGQPGQVALTHRDVSTPPGGSN